MPESIGSLNPALLAYLQYAEQSRQQGIQPLSIDQWQAQQASPKGPLSQPGITVGVRG